MMGPELTRLGPLIIFHAPIKQSLQPAAELLDTIVTLQIAWRQDGCSTGIITRWDQGSDASCERHMNLDWNGYWKLFLDMITDDYVVAVMSSESLVKY